MTEPTDFDDLGFQRRLAELAKAHARARGILGVDEAAGDAAIHRAYRRLARRHHPDRCPDDPEAHRRFLLIRAAYELLAHGTLDPVLTSERNPSESKPTGKYNMDSAWGHFLWWRARFFDGW